MIKKLLIDLKEKLAVKIKNHKIKFAIIIVSTILVIIIGIILLVVVFSENEKVVYRETTVTNGDLTVGVTEDGTVSIGTVEQTFDLDISAFEASVDLQDTQTTNTGMGGFGMDMMSVASEGGSSSASTTTSSTTSTTGSRELEVEEVYVSVGSEVKEGDSLFKLTKDSVESIRSELEKDVTSASLTLEQLKNEQKVSNLTASQTYESNVSYGAVAQQEYDVTISQLQQTVLDKQTALEDAKEEITLLQEELGEQNTEYEAAKTLLADSQYGVDHVDKLNDIYWYMQYENARETAESSVESLENQIEQTQASIEAAQDKLPSVERELNQAGRDLASQTLKAKAVYETRELNSATATEEYDVTVGYLEADLKEVQLDYDEAVKKLEDFDQYIVNDCILAESDGVVTEVSVEPEDVLSSSQTLVALNNQADMVISVDVPEEDMDAVELGSSVNISVDSYPETIFVGTVSEISDAETNATTSEVSYPVSVLISGDVSGLYEGMTGEVTFITKESEKVTYVANRAIIREGAHSYVKMKDENGKIVRKEVTTGFSDGINVEIVEGLLENQIVLMESKVAE